VLSKVCCVVNCSGAMHPYAPMYIGSICPMQYAGNLVAQTELARQRMRGCLQLGKVARAHLTWLFEQLSRQDSCLKSAFLLACLNLTLLYRTLGLPQYCFLFHALSSYILLSLGCLSRSQRLLDRHILHSNVDLSCS